MNPVLQLFLFHAKEIKLRLQVKHRKPDFPIQGGPSKLRQIPDQGLCRERFFLPGGRQENFLPAAGKCGAEQSILSAISVIHGIHANPRGCSGLFAAGCPLLKKLLRFFLPGDNADCFPLFSGCSVCPVHASGCRRHGFHGKPRKKILKSKLCIKPERLRRIKVPDSCLLRIQRNLRIRSDGRKEQRHPRLLLVLRKGIVKPLFRDFLQVLVDTVHRMIPDNQVRCRLRPHLRNARNVVRGISLKCLYLNKLRWSYLQRLQNILCIVILDDRLALFRLRDPDLNVFICNLKKIPVSGDKSDLHAACLRLLRNRPENIICLQPGPLADGNPHGLQHLLHQRDLLPQLIRHGMPRSFIICKSLMTEGRRMNIKRNRQILRLLLIQNLKQNLQKAIYGSCMKSRRIGQIRHSVKCPVQYAVSVNQY